MGSRQKQRQNQRALVRLMAGGAIALPFWANGAIAENLLPSEPPSAAALEMAQQGATPIQITAVRLESTEAGVEVVLETAAGELAMPTTTITGNALLVDIPNAVLQLPSGEAFEQFGPATGIALLSVTALPDNRVQVAITGTDAPPTVATRATAAGLTLTLQPGTDGSTTVAADEGLQIVVTATRTAEDLQTLPRSVTVLTRDDIEQQSALTSDFRDILGNLVPGFGPPTSAATPRSIVQNLRGRSTTILFNGIPLTGNYGLDRELRALDPSTVERVEVVRGPTAVYGSQATGGVINIITRAPANTPMQITIAPDIDGTFRNLGDSFGHGLQLGVSGDDGEVDYVFSLRRQQTGAAFDAEGDRIPETSGGGVIDATSYAFLGSMGYRFDPDQQLRFTLSFYDGRQNTGFLSDPAVNQEPGVQKARPLAVNLGREGTDLAGDRSFTAGLSYSHDNLWGSRLQGNLYYRDYTSIVGFSDFRGGFFDVIGRQRASGDKWGAQAQVETPLWDAGAARLLWGVDYVNENNVAPFEIFDPVAFDTRNTLQKVGDRTFVPPYGLEQLGLFAQVQWDVSDRFRLSGGLRHERIGLQVDDYTTFFGDAITGGNQNFDATVFNLGTSYDLTPELTAFASFAQGFSVPTFGGVLRNPPAGFVSVGDGLRLTEPVTVNNYEIGLRGNWPGVQASLAGFYNTSALGEDYTFVGGVSQLVRAPERIYGVEATVDWRLADTWSLGGTLGWTEGENDENDTGDYLPISTFRIQPLKLTAYLENETLPGWRNRIQALYSGSRDRAFAQGVDSVGITDYFVVDLISQVAVGPGTLQVGVQNLFNTQYFPVQSQFLSGFNETFNAAGEGRTFRLGYRVQF
ncbi:MAG: outer membrane receptor protein [Leptolyngbya sp.]|nr:MAG: outer membrane receptor protein [Leptolyngbya sp.]